MRRRDAVDEVAVHEHQFVFGDELEQEQAIGVVELLQLEARESSVTSFSVSNSSTVDKISGPSPRTSTRSERAAGTAPVA